MTHRTESAPPTPIEQATAKVLATLSDSISHSAVEFDLRRKQQIDEREFRRILALHFENKSLAEWCRDLRIEDITNPDDKPTHGGEA